MEQILLVILGQNAKGHDKCMAFFNDVVEVWTITEINPFISLC
ncbi:hypothetical protein [Raoultella ornithinolytica]|nr:hypothetical protein [Raoultella ornithinolytica]